MASFDRAIPPGGQGEITITLRTSGYDGHLKKSASVYTNDPKWKTAILSVKAFVKAAIHVSPRYVRLRGKEGEIVTKVVTIQAGLDKPLKLSPDGFSLEGKVTYLIEEIEKGRRFKVRFTNLAGPPQAYSGVLSLKTNYPEKPVIHIRIGCRFG